MLLPSQVPGLLGSAAISRGHCQVASLASALPCQLQPRQPQVTLEQVSDVTLLRPGLPASASDDAFSLLQQMTVLSRTWR